MDKIVLVGNPNTGKTTLFNGLTKGNEHTGNWHGVTVDSKEKKIKLNNKEFMVVDLPGVYSLTPLSFEEKVTCNYLYNEKDYVILNIVDVNNLYRNFYLTLDILQLNVPTILVINKMGKSSAKKYIVNAQKLEQKLGIKVVEVDAKNKNDIQKLKEIIVAFNFESELKNIARIIKNDEKIENLIQKTKKIINFNKKGFNLNANYVCLKCLEKDENVIKNLNLTKEQVDGLKLVQEQTSISEIAKNKYEIIDQIFDDCKIKNKTEVVYGKSKIDKFVLNKYLCVPILILIILFVFYLTFFSVGKFFSECLSDLIQNNFGKFVCDIVKSITNNQIIIDFFSVAVIGGLGSIFSFLPQVVILLICLGILEDSGYLSRVAFMLDDVLSKVGLSGKSVYTLLMGFGCSAVACLTARTMEDKNSQIKTAMIAPYLSCSAKLPIYSVLGSAFFGASNVFVVFAMYLLGVIVALLLSVIYEKTILKTKKQTFILEFPEYKMVGFNRILVIAWQNVKQFIVRIGTVLFSVNVIVWVLTNFSFTFAYVPQTGKQSILEVFGMIVAPIFTPLGFGCWGAVSALLAGLVAKELVVSSIAMINNVPMTDNFYLKLSASLTNRLNPIWFTPASAISYMVFCLLYSPCLATMAVLKKEIGAKWFLFGVSVQFVLAYLVSLIVFHLVNIVINKGVVFLLLYALLFMLFVYILNFIIKKIKTKNCIGCGKCR